MTRLLQWGLDEGYGDPAALDEDWGTVGIRFMMGELSMEDMEAGQERNVEFFATRSKTETMRAAVERKLLLAPVLSLDEIIDGEQLTARRFPVPQKSSSHSEPVRFPGPSAKFSVSPIAYRRGPPGVDEHGDEIRGEATRTPAPCGAEALGARPLEGVKILDLFWVLAGPGATRMLADYGATVVHVESTQHVDTCRVIPPFQYANVHPEGAAAFQCANANKLGMTLDITSEAGREVIHSLVRWADVVTESFAPGVMSGYGLGYDDLAKIDPEIVMISSCLMGQTGPWRDFSGFGTLAAAVTGYQYLASWPDRPPSGPYGAYTDFIAVRYNAIAILAALEYRRRTGRGQHIDMSQAEAGLHFIAPAFLDYTVNGKVADAVGNWDALQSPHDFYAVKGDGRWVAIAVDTEAQWQALCELIGRSDLVDRREDTAVVDAALSEWTQQREPTEVVGALQRRGIPAHEALDMLGLFADPQLNGARGHYVEIPHSIYPTTTIESSRLSLSRSEPAIPESALSVGRDNERVLREILGMSDEEIAALTESGIMV
jgi:crotonobetainyl-CoA:carnitine CoA-transferase CaiB-like acyl-CoA transferase